MLETGSRDLDIVSRTRLDKLLNPRSVAVVGASADPGKLSGKPVANLLRFGFEGAIYPVNPRYDAMSGLRCFPSLQAVGATVDLALILTPAERVIAAIEDGIAAGTHSFAVFASGFAEIGDQGAERQDRLIELAREANVRILGPNCTGLLNSRSNLCATFSTVIDQIVGDVLPSGRTAFAGQSGAIASYWLQRVIEDGGGISKWLSTGNEADLSLAQAIAYLVEEPDTDVICTYIEGVRIGGPLRDAFLAALKAGKPVLALRAGRSRAGAAAAASHTGALAGENAVWEALYHQTGVIPCASLNEMIDTLKIIRQRPRGVAKRPLIMSISGGAGALATDAAEDAGLTVAAPMAETIAALSPIFPDTANVSNPLDFTGALAADPELFRRCAERAVTADEFDSFVIFLGLMSHAGRAISRAVAEVLVRSGKLTTMIWTCPSAEVRRNLIEAGIPFFEDIPNALSAVERWNNWRTLASAVHGDRAAPPPRKQVGRFLSEIKGQGRIGPLPLLNWPTAQLMTDHGLGTYPSSYPVVAKLQSGQMPHKTEHGGIVLNIRGPGELAAAIARLRAVRESLGIACDGVLVQSMIAHDHELLLGIRSDPVFGPLLAIGRGGVEAECEKDVVIRLLPLTVEEIEVMLRSLRYSAQLAGTRGRQGIDFAALAEAIASLCEVYLADPHILEIEINPLAVSAPAAFHPLDLLVKIDDDC